MESIILVNRSFLKVPFYIIHFSSFPVENYKVIQKSVHIYSHFVNCSNNYQTDNMKKFTLIVVFVIANTLLFSQNENYQRKDTTTYEYCEVVSITKNLSPVATVDAVNVFIDFGRGQVFSPETPLKDDKGEELKFNSQIDCLNYLAKQGWRVGQTTTFFQTGTMTQRSITRYTLSRPKYGIKR